MSRMPIATAGSPSQLLRGFGHLFWLYFSWRSVVLGCACVGLVMLALALASWIDPYRAYSLSLLSFIFLLGIPFLAAPPMLRKLLGHRSISIVPCLPLLAGVALMLLTLLTAIFVPSAALMLNMPSIGIRFGVQIFIIASLYICIVQVLMISKYGVLGFSLLPILLIGLVAQFGVAFLQWFSHGGVLLGLGSITVAGWVYALLVLAKRSAFHRPFVSLNTDYTNNNSLQGFARLGNLDLGRGASPTGTLLLAYPASPAVRFINIAAFVLLSPLVGALLLTLGPDQAPGGIPLLFLNSFMMMSLTCGCLSCFAYGELGARARLLWLRVGGDRARLWQLTERELWINLAILAALLLAVTSIAAWFNRSLNPLHYCLIVLACATFDTYRGLCARLYCWPSLLQLLVLLMSLGSLAGAVAYSTINSNFSVLLLVETGFVLLAILFRSIARAGFLKVDWLVIKHAISKRATANT